MLVRDELCLGRHPATGCLTVNVTSLGSFFSARLDLHLRPIHASLEAASRLGSNLYAGVQPIIHLHIESQVKVAILHVGT